MNRLIINIIIFCLFPVFLAGKPSGFFFPAPDTIPPPPPSQAVTLSGPGEACVGETSVYITEVPVACTCQWAVNGVIQPENTPEFSITWTQSGFYIVSLVFICSNTTTDPVAVGVDVRQTPEVSLGNDTTILQGQTLLLDAGNPGSNYLWSTGATTQTILVGTAGTYSVTVSNNCGTDSDEITVSVIVGTPDRKEENIVVFHSGGRLVFKRLPEDLKCIQVVDPLGRIIYDDKPRDEIRMSQKGLVFIRFLTRDGVPVRKLVIP